MHGFWCAKDDAETSSMFLVQVPSQWLRTSVAKYADCNILSFRKHHIVKHKCLQLLIETPPAPYAITARCSFALGCCGTVHCPLWCLLCLDAGHILLGRACACDLVAHRHPEVAQIVLARKNLQVLPCTMRAKQVIKY